MDNVIKERLDFARELADAAEKIILPYYQDPHLPVELKRDKTVVTRADREAEQHLRQLIAQKFPADSLIGEEWGTELKQSAYQWVLDPIDGTEAFVCGVPLFGTLIALLKEQQPLLGVVNFPALKEIYYGVVGEGAWWQSGETGEPRKARVSEIAEPRAALFCTTAVNNYAQAGCAALYPQLLQHSGKARGWGDCYGHMLVATGRAELMVDPVMHIWDNAALFPIVTGAGGHFFDLQGRPIIDGGSGISTNAALYQYYLKLIAG